MLGEFGTVGGLVPSGFDRYLLVEHEPGDYTRDWDAPNDLLEALALLLGEHTSTPDTAWFAIWEGYGFDRSADDDLAQVAQFDLPHRRYYLVTGGVGAAATLVRPGRYPAPVFRSPDLWWPDDRSWFVATDTDLPWSYVGADDAVCSALAASFPERTRTVPWTAWNGTLIADSPT